MILLRTSAGLHRIKSILSENRPKVVDIPENDLLEYGGKQAEREDAVWERL